MRSALALGMFLLAGLAVAAPDGDERPRIAVLPLADSSGDPGAAALVSDELVVQLERIGLHVLPPAQADVILHRGRIRNVDSLSREESRVVSGELQASYLLAGRVLALRRQNPAEVGVTVRIVDSGTGQVLWSNSRSATGDQYAALLGRGALSSLDDLLPRVVGELLSTLRSDDGVPAGRRNGGLDPQALAPDPIVFRNRGSDWSEIRVVGVLPLENFSRRSGAEGILRDILVDRLWRSGRFVVIEPGEVRGQLRRLALFPSQVGGAETVGRFLERSGIDALLGGSVVRYEEAPPGNVAFEPVVEIYLQLVSTHDGTVLWSGIHARRGGDASSLWGAGLIRSAADLARALSDDLLATLPRAKKGHDKNKKRKKR